MAQYKWDNPHDWLSWKRQTGELSDGEILNTLLCYIDCDDVQDAFQSEMSNDGYFKKLDT